MPRPPHPDAPQTDAPRPDAPLRVIHLGLPSSGGRWLAALFMANGLKARHDSEGVVARHLRHATLAGAQLLAPWPGATLFCELHDERPPPAAPITPGDLVEPLVAALPQALWVLTTRDPMDWLADRVAEASPQAFGYALTRHGGDREALAEDWLAGFEAHGAAMRARFAGHPRFLEIDLDRTTPAEIAARFAPWVQLATLPKTPVFGPLETRQTRARRAARRLDPPASPALASAPHRPDTEMIEAVASFCLGTRAPSPDGPALPVRSRIWGVWDGDGAITADKGRPLRARRDGAGGLFYADPSEQGTERVAGAVNEAIAAAPQARDPLIVDMADGRPYGRDGEGVAAPARPFVVYNRRAGVANLVLWPLHAYHTPGNPAYVSARAPDAPGWSARLDTVVWRGNITGRSARKRSAAALYAAIEALAPDDPARAPLLDELDTIPRVQTVRALRGRPGFDLALTPGFRHAAAWTLPSLAPLLSQSRPIDWFSRFRYVLSIPGHDTGSNFLMAANAGALVLKEEDGWELFYTGLFRPWEHYVPLAPLAADAEEKLDWARSHPRAVAGMVAAARETCRRLADPATRAGFLAEIRAGATP